MTWTPRPLPARTILEGRYARLEPFDPPTHAAGLHAAYAEDTENDLWRFRDVGPFPDDETFRDFAGRTMIGEDPFFFAILDKATGEILGSAALMRIVPAHGVIEVGTIGYSPRLKRTRIATDAMYLMARHVFEDLGYRRYEWKCDRTNEPSKRAALRLGFTFEGVFRQHMMVAGKNRDTAWFAMLDTEWPKRKAALEQWLDPENFDAEGRQKRSLEAIREALG